MLILQVLWEQVPPLAELVSKPAGSDTFHIGFYTCFSLQFLSTPHFTFPIVCFVATGSLH